MATLPFPVVDHCRNHLATLYSVSPWLKIPNLPLEFRPHLLKFQWHNCFRFWPPYRYFRLSFDVTVTCWHFLRARPGRKPHVYMYRVFVYPIHSRLLYAQIFGACSPPDVDAFLFNFKCVSVGMLLLCKPNIDLDIADKGTMRFGHYGGIAI